MRDFDSERMITGHLISQTVTPPRDTRWSALAVDGMNVPEHSRDAEFDSEGKSGYLVDAALRLPAHRRRRSDQGASSSRLRRAAGSRSGNRGHGCRDRSNWSRGTGVSRARRCRVCAETSDDPGRVIAEILDLRSSRAMGARWQPQGDRLSRSQQLAGRLHCY